MLNSFVVFIYTVDVPDYCTANTKRVLPDPDNCAHYYNCSSVPRQGVPRISSATALGKYGAECQYPDLFDDLTQQCRNFTDVNCSTRTEPQAPCEYTILCARFLMEAMQYKSVMLIHRNINVLFIFLYFQRR